MFLVLCGVARDENNNNNNRVGLWLAALRRFSNGRTPAHAHWQSTAALRESSVASFPRHCPRRESSKKNNNRRKNSVFEKYEPLSDISGGGCVFLGGCSSGSVLGRFDPLSDMSWNEREFGLFVESRKRTAIDFGEEIVRSQCDFSQISESSERADNFQFHSNRG